jgi:hypothetical protein
MWYITRPAIRTTFLTTQMIVITIAIIKETIGQQIAQT